MLSKLLLIGVLVSCASSAYADKLIVEKETKLVKGVTSRTSPELPDHLTTVDVPDGFDIGGGPWKWSGSALEAPTKLELDKAADNEDPMRVKKRVLMTAIRDAKTDPTSGAKMGVVLTALEDFFK